MPSSQLQKVFLGAGCFWCIEGSFNSLKGVRSAVSGFMGGNVPNPSYERVCKGDTNHAEVVAVEYDESEIKFSDILDVYFYLHDPTSLNRQGGDIGTQYRSVLFYTTPEQKEATEARIAQLSSKYPLPIVTQVLPAQEFYRAENYHQGYCKLPSSQSNPYVQNVSFPKILSVKKHFPQLLK